MDERPENEPRRLRKLAKELRLRAADSQLPGYSEKLVQAAVELERRANDIEAVKTP
jgi:hypothetical protein